jgi:hypothetical protein
MEATKNRNAAKPTKASESAIPWRLVGIEVHDRDKMSADVLARREFLDHGTLRLTCGTDQSLAGYHDAVQAAEKTSFTALENARSWFYRNNAEYLKWRRLDSDVNTSKAKLEAIRDQANAALADADKAMADGKDPAEAEAAFRSARTEEEITERRFKSLTKLATDARATAETALRAFLENKRAELVAKRDAEFVQERDELLHIISERFLPLETARAATAILVKPSLADVHVGRRRDLVEELVQL